MTQLLLGETEAFIMPLTTPPENLKEAIDWLALVGGGYGGLVAALATVQTELGQVNANGDIQQVVNAVKNITSLTSKDDVSTFATKVKDYFKEVLQKVESDGNVTSADNGLNTKVQNLKTQLETLVTNVGQQDGDHPINVGDQRLGGQTQGLHQYISPVNNGSNGALRQLYNAFNSGNLKKSNTKAYALSAAAYNGANLFVTVLQTDYTSYYKGATWTGVSGHEATCAKIFLSCLPLIFNGLSYLYWKFSSNGGWNGITLGSPEPKAFMNIMTDKSRLFNGNKSASEIVSQAFKNFNEFNSATSNATSYADFLRNFKNKGLTTWQGPSNANNHFLSGLYLCSTSYFRHQHQKKAATARPPSSIREMLYWLIGLTATPQFGDLLGHIDDVVGTNFSVAVSGSSKQNETLSPDQVTSYILSTCYTCPSVLNVIQGSLAFNTLQDDPWLHRLYSNEAFPFMYPSSGAALFYALSDYTYALQFQLTFLYKQCQDMYINTCGWQFCNFGKTVNATVNEKVVSSHICSVGCTTGGQHSGGNHAPGDCGHTGCGQSDGKGSPLQAFLTDNLHGLCRKHPGTSSHLAECSGSTCHVPMGFTIESLRNTSSLKLQGGHILNALKLYCGSHNTPLRQLCGTLTCLSKRAPRSLGDLFGFYWQVTGQLFNDVKTKDSDPSDALSSALSQLLDKLTTVKSGLLYDSITARVESIGNHFFGLSWHCHRKNSWQTKSRTGADNYCTDHSNSKKARDLMSLYDSECTQNSATCGKYLEPLGISSGATFANNHAFTYLSWATYLTDELYESLQEFLESLNGQACKNCGHSCSNGHSASTCSCPSVVDCADVLPHLYANGFNFKDAFSLKGMKKESDKKTYTQTAETKRQCSAFATQLQSVISGNPLKELLGSIDEFLYMFRFYFLTNLSGFWTIYICLILYTFFFLLDTLHLRSHLKLTSSHMVPPLALLTSGTPLPITKLTYITQ
ncbi:variant erythrocyte surface antigen-1 family protein [Babesia caballi]|uniref:Variant erythrocyte surface antigen-1 family protein n=1 Tax=Babesia caballi TaxID=5871 RepID=A0AAV4LNT8_BABCB|nr:variant erythrocyte surface antigen-1 family protein [Babesia caballi]